LRRRREGVDRPLLSSRELQIVLLPHDGLRVPQIAGELLLILSTAKTCVSRVYEKLGARDRAQALMTAMRMELFEKSATRSEFDPWPAGATPSAFARPDDKRIFSVW